MLVAALLLVVAGLACVARDVIVTRPRRRRPPAVVDVVELDLEAMYRRPAYGS